MRGRLHRLEQSDAAAVAAQAALATARSLERETWSRRQKVVAIGLGAVTALCSVGALVVSAVAAFG